MPIITVENLSKKYILNHQQRELYTNLRDVFTEGAKSFGRRVLRPFTFHSSPCTKAYCEEFWALNDISFEIGRGERVGIIGRNGAGKSTLLKILSRITEPTKGRVKIKGRVASLLEVGTGFHPELTGRENIYLNGAILGMSHAEIQSRFDEIVAFAEVEKFLDTPVKRYSSGMYVRLAFAVAAHLEPEILIVDEVLAVGDAQFQKKCLGKMEEVGKEGRTVLFVSHNMQAVRQLCNRTLLLRSGCKVNEGEPARVIEYYLQDVLKAGDEMSRNDIIKNLPPDPAFRLEGIELRQNGRAVDDLVESGKPLVVEITFQVLEQTRGLRVYFDLCDDRDTLIFRSFHDEESDGVPTMTAGKYVSKALIPANLLGPLSYELRVRAGIFNVRSCLPPSGICIPINVEMTGRYNRAYLGDQFRGRLGLAIYWTTERQGQ